MYINWKALLSIGFAFWGILCCTDLLGDSTWKRCSYNIEDILTGHYKEISKIQARTNDSDGQKQKMSWPILLWNTCAFLCSLVFCSVIRNRQALTMKFANKTQATEASSGADITNDSLKKNLKVQECLQLSQEIEDLKTEKNQLTEQLVIAQKENLTARQQIEEYKLETFMMNEKLARTTNTLKENLKYKDFANANQEIFSRKTYNLEMLLKEVSQERDLLRSKLSHLEKNCLNLEEKLKLYEKQDSESNAEPVKDTSEKLINNEQTEGTEPEIDICKFQKKIIELQKSIGTFERNFEANSKISVDLDESSLDTSKDSDTKSDLNTCKQNILSYSAYKTEIQRPKLRLSDIKEKLYATIDTTGSSSDENSSDPRRIISSTVEFQNFLKSLTLNQSDI